MKLYACYTPSHRPLLEQHFLPSLPGHWKDRNSNALFDTEVVLKQLTQRSPTGEFESDGFQVTCLDKVDFILEALARETEPFLFSDVDVRFYGPVVDDLLKCLGDADMAFQWDGERGRECTGFMVIRPTRHVLNFWRWVRDRMARTGEMDQDAVHAVLEEKLFDLVRANTVILPERYWTFGRDDKHWHPGMPVNPPADLLAHHANWTVGVENKLKLLEAVMNETGPRHHA
jgi:hypothetical protein